MKNILTRKNLCVLGSLMILLGIFFAYYTYDLKNSTFNYPVAVAMATTEAGLWLTCVAAASLAFSAISWYLPAGVIGIGALVLSLLNLVSTLQNNVAVAGKSISAGIVRAFGPGFWIFFAGSVILTVFAFSGLAQAVRKKKEGASPRPQFRNILCRKNLCVLSGLLIAFGFFLPVLVLGRKTRIYVGFTPEQFQLGFLAIVFGLGAVLFSAVEKFIPALAAGIASSGLCLYDYFFGFVLPTSGQVISVPDLIGKSTNLTSDIGLYVLPAASIALIVFSVWGFIEKRKRLQALLAERLIP